MDQENPISPIQRQSSGVVQSRDSNVPSSRVGKWLACDHLSGDVKDNGGDLAVKRQDLAMIEH